MIYYDYIMIFNDGCNSIQKPAIQFLRLSPSPFWSEVSRTKPSPSLDRRQSQCLRHICRVSDCPTNKSGTFGGDFKRLILLMVAIFQKKWLILLILYNMILSLFCHFSLGDMFAIFFVYRWMTLSCWLDIDWQPYPHWGSRAEFDWNNQVWVLADTKQHRKHPPTHPHL